MPEKEKNISNKTMKLKSSVYVPGDVYEKVQHLFFDLPDREFTLTELVKLLKISKSSASMAVKKLISESFLNKKVIGKSWQLSCNPQHEYNYTRKLAYHLRLIADSEIVKIVRLKNPGAKSIILFGSVRKGDDKSTSDIDIAVEVSRNEKLEIVPLGKIPRFGYRKKVPVNIHVFSRSNISINLFANISNGIVLDGFLEVNI